MGQGVDKVLFISEFESIIIGILNTKCIKIATSYRFSASWTSPMTRVNSHSSIKLFKFLNWVIKHTSQISTSNVWSYSKIWSSYLSKKNSISREKSNIFSSWVDQLKTWALHSMSRSVKNFYLDISKVKYLSISTFVHFECVYSSCSWRTHYYWDFKFCMPREEISMVVGKEYVFKGWSFRCHIFVVCFNIKNRINEDALFLRLNIVREYWEFRGFKLCNWESLSSLLSSECESGVHI